MAAFAGKPRALLTAVYAHEPPYRGTKLELRHCRRHVSLELTRPQADGSCLPAPRPTARQLAHSEAPTCAAGQAARSCSCTHAAKLRPRGWPRSFSHGVLACSPAVAEIPLARASTKRGRLDPFHKKDTSAQERRER
ncbi:hypothetical protein PVAP13_2NG127603 [Panicum virgatum]|uniref:Uncharacterized protein n=1 Tax=Panicum virgatum TaxID=38727 RepID=A0A8T0VEI3_PANVG|nr:hypothetical protein PVAP13_2NG127603 [Panicum virgatum]